MVGCVPRTIFGGNEDVNVIVTLVISDLVGREFLLILRTSLFISEQLYFVSSKLTSDGIVDILQEWWQTFRLRLPQIQTLVINQDNGPENNSSRTQLMKRLVEFAKANQLQVQLAYYPPYHSKYHPIERVWAVLEHHWNGSLLDDLDTAVQFAKTMTWKGKHPLVKVVTQTYQTGVKLTKVAMTAIESQIERLTGLGKWFIKIAGPTEA
ncbi:MAG: hypothetical protein BWK78_07625 [Thiotrichaceae bacterium IS1]|nr:MAG: hypothetical protein BWK78_07625 [Thiotrichaceae bacterium IS1]